MENYSATTYFKRTKGKLFRAIILMTEHVLICFAFSFRYNYFAKCSFKNVYSRNLVFIIIAETRINLTFFVDQLKFLLSFLLMNGDVLNN